jgi:hypothetical protein
VRYPGGAAAEQADEADEAFGGTVPRMEAPPHARAGRVGRGHRFAAYPRCSADHRREAKHRGTERHMTFIPDLADYGYANSAFGHPGTKAVGWLSVDHDFPSGIPKDEDLDLLWQFSSIAVAHMRGGHFCEFCPKQSPCFVERREERRFLGAAELRVFSRQGEIYATPDMIYHYVAAHHYQPPDEFLRALREGPQPPHDEYFGALARINLEWRRRAPLDARSRWSG